MRCKLFPYSYYQIIVKSNEFIWTFLKLALLVWADLIWDKNNLHSWYLLLASLSTAKLSRGKSHYLTKNMNAKQLTSNYSVTYFLHPLISHSRGNNRKKTSCFYFQSHFMPADMLKPKAITYNLVMCQTDLCVVRNDIWYFDANCLHWIN